MKRFVSILTMLLFVVFAFASPPPDPLVTFDCDTVMVVQDTPNVDFVTAEAQEVACIDIGNPFVIRQISDVRYCSKICRHCVNNCIVLKQRVKMITTSLNSYRCCEKNMTEFKFYTFAIDLKNSNYGYPLSANKYLVFS
jgi:hypothetical protein